MSDDITETVYVPPNWVQIKFGLFLFGEILSVPCYLFVFFHLLAKKAERKGLHNHAIVVMLFFNFIIVMIDLSLLLDYFRQGTVSPLIPALCLINQFVDFGFFYAAIYTMLWISIERHILIFHSKLLATRRGRLIFHYIPLAFFALNTPVFYFYFLFIYPCTHTYDTTDSLCGGSCYRRSVESTFFWFVSIAHDISPIILIVLIGGAFLLRVVMQKRRLQQAQGWRKYRKIIAISGTYIIFHLPVTPIYILQLVGSNAGSEFAVGYLYSMNYVPSLVLSYVTLITLPEVKQKLSALIICKKNRQVIVPIS